MYPSKYKRVGEVLLYFNIFYSLILATEIIIHYIIIVNGDLLYYETVTAQLLQCILYTTISYVIQWWKRWSLKYYTRSSLKILAMRTPYVIYNPSDDVTFSGITISQYILGTSGAVWAFFKTSLWNTELILG